MINDEKWVKTLPRLVNNSNEKNSQIDHDIWVNTIAKKNTNYSIKIYSLIAILFVSGLILVSAVKNISRDLQKEIVSLEKSINIIELDLKEAVLDNEILTSPENITLLAKEHLNTNFLSYTKSQIKDFSKKSNFSNNKLIEIKKENNVKNLSKKMKSKVVKNIKKKKEEAKKFQKFYANPKLIPNKIRKKVTKKINNAKVEVISIYDSPKDAFTNGRVQKWGVIQVVKAFLGIPIVPGR
jgi:hypothetical protein